MPKTNLCRPGWAIATEKLTKWISRQDKQKVIAEYLGTSQQMVSYKIKHNSFTAEDLLKIFHGLGTEPEEIARVMTFKR